MPMCRCPACGSVFSGLQAFDTHQQWRYKARKTDKLRCIDPENDPRFVKNKRGQWTLDWERVVPD